MGTTILIRDNWTLARPKHKYKGHYPSGFLERARVLIVGGMDDAIICHVCGGMAHEYNGVKGGITLRGYGRNDIRMDIDPATTPDICVDVRTLDDWSVFYPLMAGAPHIKHPGHGAFRQPDGFIIDRDYGPDEADMHTFGRDYLPDIHKLTRDCVNLAPLGAHVGVLDYVCPNPGPNARMIADIGITVGSGNKKRGFWVFRKVKG